MTEGGAPHGHEQDLEEQDLTSVSREKHAAPACDNPCHEHRSPVPGLALCLDCFRSWQVPLEVIPPTLDPEGGEGKRQTTACSL